LFSVHTKRTRVTLSIKPNLFVVKPNDWLHECSIFRTLSHNVIFQGICSVTLCLLRFKKQCPFDIKCLEKTFFTTGMLLRAELHWKKIAQRPKTGVFVSKEMWYSQNEILCTCRHVLFIRTTVSGYRETRTSQFHRHDRIETLIMFSSLAQTCW